MPESAKHWITSYCEYINKYIMQVSVRGKAEIPGEHHFVAAYLLPRLVEFSSLGIPHYINPDGLKGGTGDLVFWSYAQQETICYIPTPRLSIEVKLENPDDNWFQLTRLQYYHWIRQEWRPEKKGKPDRAERPAQPDLFLGISRHGVALLPWAAFRDVYIGIAYPSGLVDIRPVKGRPAPTSAFPMSEFAWNGANNKLYFPYSRVVDEWPERETSFVASLKEQCAALALQGPVQSLGIRPDL